MSNSYKPLEPAHVAFDANGTLRSVTYNDVYHSGSGAFGQAEHVFLQGNQLPWRWRGRHSFTVCETGFGLGRNFLALWDAWRNDSARSGHLHVVSFEAHPFSRSDLAALLLPGLPVCLRALGEALVAAWPSLLPGLHRLEFASGALTLTLAFGPVQTQARQIEALVDAYFLDGFSPDKNPQMWTPRLFGQLVRMAGKNATASSWCCASHVRKALSDAGFVVEKAPGFGRKGEMMTARLRPPLGRDSFARRTAESVVVIGGGIAGAGVAHGLAAKGHQVVVADPVFELGRGASQRGHLAAALTPLIAKDDNPRARLTRAGIARARQRWSHLSFAPARCGTLELAMSTEDAWQKRQTLACLAFPDDWVRWVDRHEASALSGLSVPAGGLFFADGHLVQPEFLLQELLDHDGITCCPRRAHHIGQDEQGTWTATDDTGHEIARAPILVLANASQARSVLANSGDVRMPDRIASMKDIAGQVSYFAAGPLGLDTRVNLSGHGYWLPSVRGLAVAGGTYDTESRYSAVTTSGHCDIARKLAPMLGLDADQLLERLGRPSGWAGKRAVATGRLPVIGQVPGAPGLWVACGYGSRGLTWSALAGDVAAAWLNDEPMPLERDLLSAISPA